MSLQTIQELSVNNCVNFILFQLYENMLIIEKNNKEIKQIACSENNENYILSALNNRHLQNVSLLQENNKYLDLYISLTTFIYHSAKLTEVCPVTVLKKFNKEKITNEPGLKELFLEKTLNEDIPLNELHPFYHDDDFISEIEKMNHDKRTFSEM